MAKTCCSFKLAILVVQSFALMHGFLPNHLNKYHASPNDYTQADITEIGILRVVAEVLETSPLSTTTVVKGSLKNLPSLQAQALFDKYYGGGVSAKPLISSINEIIFANHMVGQQKEQEAKWHFGGEQIRQGNRLLLSLKSTLLQLMRNGVNDIDYTVAREMIGQYLHALQMFYSNTNWVEMKGNVTYKALGISGAPFMATAASYIMTCTNCNPNPTGLACQNNIILQGDILTSGYKSTQGSKPNAIGRPNGKCSHGGILDSTRFKSATGGINKDSTNSTISPHHYLHEQAAQAAIKATEDFFLHPITGLRRQIGESKFIRLFNIGFKGSGASGSLVFVVDISGSMSDDIAAVKAATRRIVGQTRGTANAPTNYILSTFSDPESIGNVNVTKDPDEFITWVDRMTLNGGGDCPEYAMLGIERALNAALPGSNIFVFTDAGAKDPQRLNAVSALIASKKSKINFMLSNPSQSLCST